MKVALPQVHEVEVRRLTVKGHVVPKGVLVVAGGGAITCTVKYIETGRFHA